MFNQFETLNKLGRDNAENTLKTFEAVSKGTQAIVVEVTSYAKKSIEQGVAVAEKLLGARTLDKAIEIQTDYAKTAYEGFVTHSTKLGELYQNVAREAVRPLEAAAARAKAVPAK